MRPTLLVVALSLLAGCSTVRDTFNGDLYRTGRPWLDSRTDHLAPQEAKNIRLDIATQCVGTPPADTTDCSKGGGLLYDAAKASAIARDTLQERLIKLSDEKCGVHLSAVVGTNAGSNFLLSTLASLFAGGATGFAANSTKTALSGISSFFIASRSHLNEQVYHQLFVGTILKAIDDDRRALHLSILDRQRYPVPTDAWDPRAKGDVITALTRTTSAASMPPAPPVPPLPAPATPAPATPAPATPAPTPPTTPVAPVPTTSVPVIPATIQIPPAQTEVRRFYSVDEAIRDAGEYHDRCSFYSGLVLADELN